jgi:hypothetical protein
MTYRTEFPEFDYILPVLHGFTDSSWHNDGSPSLLPIGGDCEGWTLWCQHKKTYLCSVDYGSDAQGRFILCRGEETCCITYNLVEALIHYYGVMQYDLTGRVFNDWRDDLYRNVLHTFVGDHSSITLNGIAEIQAIAFEFANLLSNYLGSEKFEAMKAAKPNLGANDFCDANVFMADAFRKVKGREHVIPSQEDCDLWNAAWLWAERVKLI